MRDTMKDRRQYNIFKSAERKENLSSKNSVLNKIYLLRIK